MDVLDRVTARVEVTELGCWEFQGCRLACGYGRVGWDGRLWLTHRLTYLFLVGPLHDGMEIDHLCRNKPCCNPAHLEQVTRSENVRRGTQGHHLAARELAKTHCPANHPYDLNNTYVTPRGDRHCRACQRESNNRYNARNREARANYARRYRAAQKEKAA